ncbi:hypothetical protein [Mycolicibacter virginiensis]|nr:hypothetical protein [Mycolicibacter virginiensis]ULP49212.1 hypothetical protein MJO54_09275 [Mycolicibacter virginiensis]
MTVDSVGAADGILMITNSHGVWRAAALNRENEHGTAVSESTGQGIDFASPIGDDQLAAMLHRILTGRAQADPDQSPHTWVYRRVLYGVARTLETGKLDGDDEPEAEDDPEGSDSKADRGGLSLADLIDGILAELFIRHVGAVADALIGGRHLAVVPSETLAGDQRWELFAEGMQHFRRLSWSDFRVEALAESWRVELESAQWWGSDGLALLQLRCIPDATESLIRCGFVLQRAPNGAAAIEHLIARTKQVFGDDIAVLWSLVPDLRP